MLLFLKYSMPDLTEKRELKVAYIGSCLTTQKTQTLRFDVGFPLEFKVDTADADQRNREDGQGRREILRVP
ncbi:MAG: hypothetical protein WC856_27645 [Methylococcaceae bacterium]|jgi:hypothetical protein